MAGTSPSTATRSWTTGAMAANAASSNAPPATARGPPASHGRQASMNVVGRQGPDVLAVHVGELGHVEERR